MLGAFATVAGKAGSTRAGSHRSGHRPANTNGNAIAARFDGIIGKSHRLLHILDHVTQVAPFDTSVLITGESGTGKEKVAWSIHQLSPRHKKSRLLKLIAQPCLPT